MNELLELRKYLDRHIAGLKPFPRRRETLKVFLDCKAVNEAEIERRCGKYRQSVPNALAVADMIIDGGM